MPNIIESATSVCRSFFVRLIVAFAAVAPACVLAQTYPDKPVRFIAPTTPGPTADVLARVFADSMSRVLREPVIVENKPGADQQIGLEYIAKSAPADGYTVGVIGIDGQALMPLVRKDLRFDPIKDLTLVAGLGEVRYLLTTPATAPWKNFKELVDAARANPGKYSYGSSTPQVHLYTLSLIQDLGLDLLHVPFPSGAPFLTAVVAGTVDWGILAEGTANSVKPRVRLYAVTGSSRSSSSPDVPTFAELGFPRIYGPSYALAVRTGTPQAIIDKLSASAAAALASTEMKANAQKILFDINFESAAGVTRALNERFKFYQDFTRKLGLKPE